MDLNVHSRTDPSRGCAQSPLGVDVSRVLHHIECSVEEGEADHAYPTTAHVSNSDLQATSEVEGSSLPNSLVPRETRLERVVPTSQLLQWCLKGT